MLPFAFRFAVAADPALHAVAAVVGPEHVTLGLDPVTWFGILVAFALVGHEVAGGAGRAFRRWWNGRRRR